MSKYRVYEVAKELQTDSKVILNILAKHNIEGKIHSSSIDDAEKQMVIKAFNAAKAKPAESVKKAEKPQAPKAQPKQEPKAAHKPAEKPAEKPAKPTQPKIQAGGKAEAKQPQKPQHNGKEKHNGQHDRNDRNQNGHNNGGNGGNDRKHNGDNNNGSRQHNNGFNNNRNGERNNRQNNQGNQNHNGSQGNRPNNGGQNVNNNRHNNQGFNSQDRQERHDRQDRRERNNNTRMEQNDRMERNNNRNKNNGNGRGNNRNSFNNANGFGGRGGKNDRNGKGGKHNRNNRQKQQPQAPKVEIARPKNIKVGESIIVKDLASKMSCTAAEIIKKLMLMGVMATINQEIDFDTAALVASEYGVNVEELPPEVDPTLIPEIEEDPKNMVLRPPVVTVMGHVDHGKTSLLDVIRKTSVSTHEAGGITQHIGAYQVNCQGKKIVFLDTPGHEAFTAMRARGAQVTDIAILVVAADDGVMPQTVEAINHAKDANVPIIVAVNKIDKPGANPENVKNELMEHGLVPEAYGGDTIMVEVSAKKNLHINDLLEMVLLEAEMLELKANPKCDARGVIIEAKLDKGRGPVATVLVQNGTLHVGDSIIAGTTYGKVRAMLNDKGENVKKAGPSVPVEVLGLNDVPAAGDEMAALEEKLTRSIAEKRIEKQRNELIHSKKVSLDDLFNQIQEGQLKELNIVVKADVQGSVEALNSSLLGLNKNDEVRVRIVHSGVGAVNESDVMLAAASNALVIAFNVRPDANARRIADTEEIDIRTYRGIYDALNDVKDAMSGMLDPKYKEVLQGRVEIRQVMKFSKALVAGSYVLEGKIFNNSKIRIVRDNIEIFDGELDGLRRFKDDVKEVAAGYECGITIQDFKDFQEGDIIEAYTLEEVKTDINDLNKD